jgi:hypothetical protein
VNDRLATPLLVFGRSPLKATVGTLGATTLAETEC